MSTPMTYPEYKDSGAAWLGKVPDHWQVCGIKFVGKTVAGSGFPHEYQGVEGEKYPFLKVNALGRADSLGVINSREDSISETVAKKLRASIIPAGSVVLAKIGAALLLGRIRTLSEDSCIDNNMLSVQTSNNAVSRFVFYAMQQIQFDVLVNPGAVPSLSERNFRSFKLAFPPLGEQHAIVSYLDRETAEIDAFIADQEELIELLNERRTATITQAVTKGLDLTVQMKDSGVEWLGKVPQGWRTASLRHLLASKLKYGANEAAEFDDPDWVRYLRITDFGYDGKLRDDTFKSLPPEVAADYMVKPHDILLARSGATVGKAFIVPEDSPPSCFAGYLIKVECDPKLLLPHFAYRFFQSTPFLDWKNASQTVATIQNIGADKYATLPMPVPPLDEQKAISDYLDYETAEIDAAIADAKEAIELSKERRAALISAAVTGKIDVRNHVTAELGAA